MITHRIFIPNRASKIHRGKGSGRTTRKVSAFNCLALNYTTIAARALLGVWMLLAASTVAAQQEPLQFEKKSGPYTVYYSLFPSTFLQPEIAETYAITRGKNNMVLNVSVRETLKDGADRGVSAVVTGTRSDLIHKLPLEFIKIREQDAIYYLAQITVTGTPTLYFDLQVQADPNASPISIVFQRRLFTD